MARIQLDKAMYEALVNSLAGVPSSRPMFIPANMLRALLREIHPDQLPEGDDELPSPTKEQPSGDV